MVTCCSAEGDFEIAFDKTDLVHMDDAMTVPATGGFYKTVAHHFYEVSNAVSPCICSAIPHAFKISSIRKLQGLFAL